MNARWKVTCHYGDDLTATNPTILGIFTFEGDARRFARSAKRGAWQGAFIEVSEIAVWVDELL